MSARVRADEALDVDPIDRRSALEAPVGVDRRDAPEIAELRGTSPVPVDDRCRTGRSLRRTTRGNRIVASRASVLFAAVKAAMIVRWARIVVVSPHSDDGVLSLGASMARWARAGTAVGAADRARARSRLVRGDGRVGSTRRVRDRGRGRSRPARGGSRVRARILGVTPSWLPFGSVDFERHGDDADVWAAVRSAVRRAAACSSRARRSPIRTTPGSTGSSRAICAADASRPLRRAAVHAPAARDAVRRRRRSALATGSRSGARSAPTARSFRSSACAEPLRRGPLAPGARERGSRLARLL